PSRYESFGLVALEAWGGGQAVVASDGGGLGEVVDDGGLLVPAERAAPLAESLLRLLRQPALGGELCRRGQQRLRSLYRPAGGAQRAARGLHRRAGVLPRRRCRCRPRPRRAAADLRCERAGSRRLGAGGGGASAGGAPPAPSRPARQPARPAPTAGAALRP